MAEPFGGDTIITEPTLAPDAVLCDSIDKLKDIYFQLGFIKAKEHGRRHAPGEGCPRTCRGGSPDRHDAELPMTDLTPTGRKRLRRLVTVLKAVSRSKTKRGQFNMNAWWRRGTSPFCGTVACACGWAAMDPVLHEQGLRLGHAKGITLSNTKILRFKSHIGYSAAAEFFEVDGWTAGRLFSAECYRFRNDPKLVIDRIQALLDGNPRWGRVG